MNKSEEIGFIKASKSGTESSWQIPAGILHAWNNYGFKFYRFGYT